MGSWKSMIGNFVAEADSAADNGADNNSTTIAAKVRATFMKESQSTV
jgi:hypothetical protein